MQEEIFLETGIVGASTFVSRNPEEDRNEVRLLRPKGWREHVVHERFFALSFDDDFDADQGSLLVSVRNEEWRVFRSRSAAEQVFLPELAEREFREPFREVVASSRWETDSPLCRSTMITSSGANSLRRAADCVEMMTCFQTDEPYVSAACLKRLPRSVSAYGWRPSSGSSKSIVAGRSGWSSAVARHMNRRVPSES